MVACTACCGLPYQQGTDAPCDLHQVWCDFAATLDADLTALTAAANRATTTVPLAAVAVLGAAAASYRTTTVIEFNSVLADTDNMVSLDVAPTLITPQRSGVYGLSGRLTGTVQPPAAGGAYSENLLATVGVGNTSLVRAFAGITGNTIPTPIHAYFNTLFDFQVGTTGPVSLALFESEGNDIIFDEIVVSVFWHSDL